MFAGQCGSGGLRTPSKFEQCSCFFLNDHIHRDLLAHAELEVAFLKIKRTYLLRQALERSIVRPAGYE